MAALFYVLCVVSCFNSGLQLLCFCRGSQASCASCGLVSPEGVWCIWLLYSGGLSCGCSVFGFLLHAQISSYLHRAPAFPVNWLIHWVFVYVSTWTGTLLPILDALCHERFTSVPAAIAYFSKSPAIDLESNHLNLYQITSNINKFLSHVFEYKTVSLDLLWSVGQCLVSENYSAYLSLSWFVFWHLYKLIFLDMNWLIYTGYSVHLRSQTIGLDWQRQLEHQVWGYKSI